MLKEKGGNVSLLCYCAVLCYCVRDVNPCVNESLPLFAFLRVISERVVYFLFVKAWFHHLPGREIGWSFNF